jgi:hypothetical protein
MYTQLIDSYTRMVYIPASILRERAIMPRQRLAAPL